MQGKQIQNFTVFNDIKYGWNYLFRIFPSGIYRSKICWAMVAMYPFATTQKAYKFQLQGCSEHEKVRVRSGALFFRVRVHEYKKCIENAI